MAAVLAYVLIILFGCSMTSLAVTKSKTYQEQTDATGRRVCSTDQPTTVISMEVSTMVGQCGVRCTVSPSCQFYQFKAALAQCELFDNKPRNTSMTFVDQCVAYSLLTTDSQVLTLVTSLSGTGAVLATALLRRQLFVARDDVAAVAVYDTTSFQQLPRIKFSGLGTSVWGLAASDVDNCLYIADHWNYHVHKVNLSVTSGVSVTTLVVQAWPRGLSVTRAGNLLVVIPDYGEDIIAEYTPNLSLVRNMTDKFTLYDVVGANDGALVVSRYASVPGVAMFSTNGKVLKSYASTQMNQPRGIAIDVDGNTLVADSGNNRILLVDPTYTTARQLDLPVSTLSCPYSISLDPSNGRLYIGENSGQNRVLVFSGYQ